jgi:hypothetical protein
MKFWLIFERLVKRLICKHRCRTANKEKTLFICDVCGNEKPYSDFVTRWMEGKG